MLTTDVLIIGGGIVGLSVARELKDRSHDLKVTVIDKEDRLARHASGRNSGVLHAGFYYTPSSLKARLTVEGNRRLTEYCLENGLPINRCGKVVVAKNERELETLFELKRRGDRNGVELRIIDEYELNEVEPNARTFHKALYSPTTSSVDPVKVVEHIGEELKREGVDIHLGERFVQREGNSCITTSRGKIRYRYLINASGLYADRIAHRFGTGRRYILIPFKGLYMKYKDPGLVGMHVYPVPDIRNPFLGVHFTKTVDGGVKIGPTATPALWRENYRGLEGFDPGELIETLFMEIRCFVTNASNFREIALSETKKYLRSYLIQQASLLVKDVDPSMFGGYLAPGIRAQLIDREKMELVGDFVVEHAEDSTHILNAVSPAFTCAFAFAGYIVDTIKERIGL